MTPCSRNSRRWRAAIVAATFALATVSAHAAASVFAAEPENLAPRAVITASSQYSDDYAARWATDGVVPDPLTHNDARCAWATHEQSAASLVLRWPRAVPIAEIVYYARTAYFLNGGFKDYEVYVDSEERPAIVGRFEARHGPQRIHLPKTPSAETLTLKFLNSHGGANPGAAELAVFSQHLDDRQLARFDPGLKRRPAIAPRPAEPTPAELDAAAAQLADKDPFVRARAEWIISRKVGRDNDGYEVIWPQESPPAWFAAWTALDRRTLVELDWCRQAIDAGIDQDAAKLRESLDKLLAAAKHLARDYAATGIDAAKHERIARQQVQLEKISQAAAGAGDDLPRLRSLWLDARRALRPIVLANPAIDFRRLAFVTQFAEHTNPNITGSQVSWKHKPGGDLCVLDGLEPDGRIVRLAAEKLGPGHVDGFDLDWDGARAVVSYARQRNWPPKARINRQHAYYHAHDFRATEEPLHLFEVRLDGSGVRQLTDNRYWSDTEPTYAPGGDIVFSSDRCGQSVMCGYGTHPEGGASELSNANLYRLSADGRDLRRLTNNKDIDRYPHCLDNGLIAYTRWEYQERDFWDVHSIWTVRPDGTMSDALFKQHLGQPVSLRSARSIPGTGKLVAIASGHHTFAYGPVVIVNPAAGLNNEAGIQIVTPGSYPQEDSPRWKRPTVWRNPVPEGGVFDAGGFYQSPFALSEKCFLVSYCDACPGTPSWGGADSNAFALYLIDVYGNKELIYRDLLYSCVSPIPVRKRAAPPASPDATDRTKSFATCILPDVYDGMPEIPRGKVKYVRISQELPWPLEPQAGARAYAWPEMWAPSRGLTRWSSVRVIGTVPVESDGSAHFRVPTADHAAVYFQALDENHMELRRMRSSISFQPGEVRGCSGCHETRASSAAVTARWNASLAARKPPQTPVPPPWGSTQPLDYPTLIQPILDRQCVRCHSPSDAKGGLDLTGTPAPGSENTYLFPDDGGFHRSFLAILGFPPQPADRLPRTVAGPAPLVALSDRLGDGSVSQPMQFGSHRSKLITTLLRGHEDVKLSRDEWIALVTWVDANAPYHGRLINQRPGPGQRPRREPYAWPDPWSGLP